jgi:hypothetical protein
MFLGRKSRPSTKVCHTDHAGFVATAIPPHTIHTNLACAGTRLGVHVLTEQIGAGRMMETGSRVLPGRFRASQFLRQCLSPEAVTCVHQFDASRR